MIAYLLLSIFALCLSIFFRPAWLFMGVSAVLAGLYFGVMEGNYLVFIIYLLGVLLLVIEFYIPDFGIVGIMGFIALITSFYLHLGDWTELVLTALGVVVVAGVSIFIPAKMGRPISLGPGFVLNTASNKESGYSTSRDLTFLVGASGVAASSLRPVGRGKFHDQYFEVISLEDMIYEGQAIHVDHVVGSRIYVRKGEKYE